MKKCIYSLFILTLVFVLLVQLTPQTYAETINSDGEYILGNDSNITGYIVPGDDENSKNQRVGADQIIFDGPGGGRYTKIFSITAAYVEDLLTSGNSKSFTLSTLPSNASYILCQGTLFHSIEDLANQDEIMRGGVCYYGYSYAKKKYIYIGVIYQSARHGVLSQQSYPIAGTLENGKTYYSYVKNIYPAGYVYGTWEIYTSEF